MQVATRRLAPPEVCKATLATVALETEQLNLFVEERLMTNEKELFKPIRTNKLTKFRTFEKAVYRGCRNYNQLLILFVPLAVYLRERNQLMRLCVTN